MKYKITEEQASRMKTVFIDDYNIYEFSIRDDEYYPEGTTVYLANDRDMKAIKDGGADDLIYHYVDDEIDLTKVKVGDILELDVDFEVLATEESELVGFSDIEDTNNTFGGDTGVDADYLYEADQINECGEALDKKTKETK